MNDKERAIFWLSWAVVLLACVSAALAVTVLVLLVQRSNLIAERPARARPQTPPTAVYDGTEPNRAIPEPAVNPEPAPHPVYPPRTESAATDPAPILARLSEARKIVKGDTAATVVERLGEPKGRLTLGRGESFLYDVGLFSFEHGNVTAINLATAEQLLARNKPPPLKAQPAPPQPTPEGAATPPVSTPRPDQASDAPEPRAEPGPGPAAQPDAPPLLIVQEEASPEVLVVHVENTPQRREPRRNAPADRRPDAFPYRVDAVVNNGMTVRLSDGSFWSIPNNARATTRLWTAQQRIRLTTHGAASRLVNGETGEAVSATRIHGPQQQPSSAPIGIPSRSVPRD